MGSISSAIDPIQDPHNVGDDSFIGLSMVLIRPCILQLFLADPAGWTATGQYLDLMYTVRLPIDWQSRTSCWLSCWLSCRLSCRLSCQLSCLVMPVELPGQLQWDCRHRHHRK